MIFRFDAFEFDEDRYELRRVRTSEAPSPIVLQPKVTEVLLHLLRNAERTLTKDELLDAVWGDVAITEASLTRCISLARHALDEPEHEPRIIQTVRGRGYKMGVPVEATEAKGPEPAPAVTAEEAPERMARSRRWPIAAGILLAAVAWIAWLARPFHEIPLSEPRPAGPYPETSVAVVPFGDLREGGERSNEGDAVALAVIDHLSGWPELRVTSYRSSFRFPPGDALEPAEIGRELGVGSLVTGTIRPDGEGQLRIQAELVHTDTGFQRWSASFVASSDDPHVGQYEVARAVGNALGVTVRATDPHQVHKGSVSRDRMLRHGRHAVLEANRTTLVELAATYERALEIDPDPLHNYVALAEIYHRLWERDGELGGGGENWLAMAEAVARQALARAPEDPHALTMLGTIQTAKKDWPGSEASLRAALAHGGGAFASHRLAVVLLIQARVEAARPHVERSLRLDPLSPDVVRGGGRFHLYADEPEHAISLLRRALELDPNDFYVPRLLANAHYALGERDAAREAFMRFMPGLVRPIARIQDRVLGTERGLCNLLWLDVRASGLPCRADPYGTALMWAFLEERDAMLACLEIAARHHLWYVAIEPLMRPYHADPEFRRIIAAAGHRLPDAS